MTGLVAIDYATSLLATALAWPVARLRREHTPITYLLTFGFASDVVRRALNQLILTPAYATMNGAPATGWLRLAGGLDQTLFLGWIAGVAAVSMLIFLQRRPWLIAIGYVVGVLGIVVLGYPALRGDRLRQAYLGFELVFLMICAAIVSTRR